MDPVMQVVDHVIMQERPYHIYIIIIWENWPNNQKKKQTQISRKKVQRNRKKKEEREWRFSFFFGSTFD